MTDVTPSRRLRVPFISSALRRLSTSVSPLVRAQIIETLIAELDRHFKEYVNSTLQDKVEGIVDRALPQRIEAIIDRLLPITEPQVSNLNRMSATPLSKDRAFEIAYGRRPSADEIEQIRSFGFSDSNSATGQIRSVMACFDHQELATPITVRFTEEDLETVDFENFRLVLDRYDTAVSRPIIASHEYEPHLSGFVKRVVRPNMTAIDIGANVGYYTMLMGALVGGRGRVLSFEPYTENCRLLMLNIEANGFKHIKIFPFALSTAFGATCFTSAFGTNGQFRTETHETLTHASCLVVPTMRLDDVIHDPVHFIKADVEGAEYLSLSGAEKLIRRFRPIITTEFSLEMLLRVSGISGAEYLKWMKHFGYRAYVLGRIDGRIDEIGDVDQYLSQWDNFYRIEDLAFIPEEANFDPR